MRAAEAEGLLDLHTDRDFDWVVASADILTVHEPAYVMAVLTGQPENLARSQGFLWSPAFAQSVVRIWSGHQAACRLALQTGLVLHPVSGAHHADYFSGGGFCTFNFLVGAARSLQREGLAQRVGVIDLDAHQGDGTLALGSLDPGFGIFDLSTRSWVGRSIRTPSLYFGVARNSRRYFGHLRHLPEWLDRTQPDLVQFQAGMDCFEGDFMGAIEGLDGWHLGQRDAYVMREVLSRRIPLVINLAGGYLDDGTTVKLHLQTIRLMALAMDAVQANRTLLVSTSRKQSAN